MSVGRLKTSYVLKKLMIAFFPRTSTFLIFLPFIIIIIIIIAIIIIIISRRRTSLQR